MVSYYLITRYVEMFKGISEKYKYLRMEIIPYTWNYVEKIITEKSMGLMEKLCLRIDEIELSDRSTNCLSGANIDTIAELVSIPEQRMLEFRNLGKNSLNEIKTKLEDMGLYLGMDLSQLGITSDNVK